MDDVAELLHPHQMIHLDRLGLADAVDIIACEIHQHDMLSSVFFGVQQLLAQPLVL
jgi:hypothetical protein